MGTHGNRPGARPAADLLRHEGRRAVPPPTPRAGLVVGGLLACGVAIGTVVALDAATPDPRSADAGGPLALPHSSTASSTPTAPAVTPAPKVPAPDAPTSLAPPPAAVTVVADAPAAEPHVADPAPAPAMRVGTAESVPADREDDAPHEVRVVVADGDTAPAPSFRPRPYVPEAAPTAHDADIEDAVCVDGPDRPDDEVAGAVDDADEDVEPDEPDEHAVTVAVVDESHEHVDAEVAGDSDTEVDRDTADEQPGESADPDPDHTDTEADVDTDTDTDTDTDVEAVADDVTGDSESGDEPADDAGDSDDDTDDDSADDQPDDNAPDVDQPDTEDQPDTDQPDTDQPDTAEPDTAEAPRSDAV